LASEAIYPSDGSQHPFRRSITRSSSAAFDLERAFDKRLLPSATPRGEFVVEARIVGDIGGEDRGTSGGSW
jgi:hypothetical protein